MKQTYCLPLFLAFCLFSCRPSGDVSTENKAVPFLPPDALFGQLFVDVQMNRVFPDGKTFVDCTPKSSPEAILEKYQEEKTKAGFDLKAFVEANFDLPTAHATGFKSDLSRTPQEHINSLWSVLTRKPDASVEGSSLLPLPKPYIVPGGRFGEVYYWDSYFTMLGLQVSWRGDMIFNWKQAAASILCRTVLDGQMACCCGYYRNSRGVCSRSFLLPANKCNNGDKVTSSHIT